MSVFSLIGYFGLFLIIFAETGLLIGFFLPGDSLLIAAGIFCFTSGEWNVYLLATLLTIAACSGDACGYLIGRTLGSLLYSRKDSFFFRKKHIKKAHDFYEKHGGKTIILARFIPIIRTFAPTIAGAAEMDYRKFSFYNLIGGVSWIWSLLLTGYFLGKYFGDIILNYIHLIILIIIIISVIPVIVEYLKSKINPS